jgi:hypothetical protein
MKLVNVPNHEFMESPSSWLTRVALRQVVSPKELARYFGVKVGVDGEMAFAKRTLRKLAAEFTDATGSFEEVDLLMGRLLKLDPYGERYLLRYRSVAFHRYCAACLATDRVKYFRLEWRFKCWRWCPLHECLLRERCPHCDHMVQLPRDMLEAGKDGWGVATLDHCLQCGEFLTKGWQDDVSNLSEDWITAWEQVLLSNGRATLATLARGKLQIRGDNKERGFMHLKNIERLGYLPHVNFRLTHPELSRRQKGE